MQLLSGEEDLELYPGLAKWWRQAEAVWRLHRSNDQLTLLQQLDYRRKLTLQLPASNYRVVYTKSGMYLAAAIVADPTAVIDQQLYWATVQNLSEGRYLTAIINSRTLTKLVAPLQARGEHNPRHFAKEIFQFPIPMYDPGNRVHQSLVEYAIEAEAIAAAMKLPSGRFELQRRSVRQVLDDSNTLNHIDQLVADLLTGKRA